MNQILTKLETEKLSSARLQSIDFLRGVVMIIMALDHVRDYFHADAFLYSPADLSYTTPMIFFTRWITHFCAPVFVLLSGTSVYLMSRNKEKKQLSFFLLKRGLWLIFLDLVILTFGWNFDIRFHQFYFNVIWMFGVSMIVLAGLVHFNYYIILSFGLLLVFGHNLLDNFDVAGNTFASFIWAVLHKQAMYSFQGTMLLIAYPIIPWVGVMALGYSLGRLYEPNFDSIRRRQILLQLGGLTIVTFIILRAVNMYGDPAPWSHQTSSVFTVLSFLKASKYPPSLLYLLMTLGPALIFLGATEKTNDTIVRPISVFGRVPLFFYVIHIFFIHLLALIVINFFPNKDWSDMILTEPLWFTQSLRGYGFSLAVVYMLWIGVVLMLYPLCKDYDRYKREHKQKWWLSYI